MALSRRLGTKPAWRARPTKFAHKKRTAVINVVGLSESLLGPHTPRIHAFRAAGAQRIDRARDLDAAVRQAHETARAMGGGTVLLSPAAASFDMFADYAARGAAFKEAVARIAAESAGKGRP